MARFSKYKENVDAFFSPISPTCLKVVPISKGEKFCEARFVNATEDWSGVMWSMSERHVTADSTFVWSHKKTQQPDHPYLFILQIHKYGKGA
mmetsp:Transcript_8055/g.29901  ORF Transcript_8055/g.29901 Transcript_8055/m.29901 type:complete len:92 (-) Transcript_8055:2297-2572(-)